MPSRRTQLAAGVALALILLPAAAAARPHRGHGPGFGHGPFFGHVLRHLDLTAEQREAIHGRLDAERGEIEARVGALKDARLGLGEAIHAGTFNEGAIRDAAAAVAAAEAEMAVLRGRLFSDVYRLLTPEQQAELGDLLGKLHDRLEEGGPFGRHGHRWHHGGLDD